MNQADLFDSLVNNALDFFDAATTEIRDKPKYSVIHFYSAVEILMKSRLLLEHWSLVWDDPKNADLNRFMRGSFRSVPLDDALKRLQAVAGTRISTAAVQTFHRLQDHRNQLVHFFHPEYGPSPSPDVLAAVVADLSVGWLHVHLLLTRTWKAQYSNYAPAIRRLDRTMMQLREYLTARYDRVKQDIEKGRRRGVVFEICTSCGFESARITLQDDPIVETECLVCESEVTRLETPCPNCSDVIAVYELGEGTCGNCGTQIEMSHLLATYGAKQTPYDAWEDPAHGYCTNCEWVSEPSVVPWDYRYLCLNCFSIYDYLEHCEWCHEKNAGDMSESYLSGCVRCEGRYGWGE